MVGVKVVSSLDEFSAVLSCSACVNSRRHINRNVSSIAGMCSSTMSSFNVVGCVARACPTCACQVRRVVDPGFPSVSKADGEPNMSSNDGCCMLFSMDLDLVVVGRRPSFLCSDAASLFVNFVMDSGCKA